MALVFMTCLCRESTASKKKKKKTTALSHGPFGSLQIVPVARTDSGTRTLGTVLKKI